MNVYKLVEIVEGFRPAGSRVVAGSHRLNTPVPVAFRIWESLGYDTMIQQRAPGLGEQFVDEALKTAIAKPLFTIREDRDKHTIVLLSGDGNAETKGSVTFPQMMTQALDQGFCVEVWSWRKSLNGAFRKLQRSNPDMVTLVELDNFRDQVLL